MVNCSSLFGETSEVLDHAKVSEILGSSSYTRLKPQRARSVVVWPDTVNVGSASSENESVDEHDSPEAAYAVCRMLKQNGFGGEGKVFPISTRVELIE